MTLETWTLETWTLETWTLEILTPWNLTPETLTLENLTPKILMPETLTLQNLTPDKKTLRPLKKTKTKNYNIQLLVIACNCMQLHADAYHSAMLLFQIPMLLLPAILCKYIINIADNFRANKYVICMQLACNCMQKKKTFYSIFKYSCNLSFLYQT